MKTNRLALLIVGLIASPLFALPPIPDNAAPVDLTVTNQMHVQVAAAPGGALRLSVSSHAIKPIQSIFLAGEKPGDSYPIGDGDWTGLKTSTGELLVNAATKQWTLKDATGQTAIPPSPLPAVAGNLVAATILGTPDDRYYGCGDVANALQFSHAQARSDNGHAVVPYFWSTAQYGVLAIGTDDNKPASWKLDEAKNPTFTVTGDSADFYFFVGNLEQVTNAYATLTGKPPVPPEWTFGYLQSRWGWVDHAYIQDTLKQFTDRKLPVDAFIFDFEWYTKNPDYDVPPQGMNGFPDFDWNSKLFPNPQQDVAELHNAGIHFVGIRKPRLGDQQTLADFRSRGWVLPGPKNGIDARVIDYHNPQVNSWYADQTVPLLKAGVDGWWDDEGELTYTTYTYWNQSQAEALKKADPNARLWTLCRAFCPGLERYGAAAWTGDIHVDWNTLHATPTTLLNWSLAGMDYCGCDIGGFTGAEDTPELLTRWMQAGVFFPVMRSHSENNLRPRFPWLYGTEAESAIRDALNLRYRLIPYYYSLAHAAYEHGDRIMRPLVMEFPDDPKVANLSDEWLIGHNLLAAPVLTQRNDRDVYIPAGDWFMFNSNHLAQSLHGDYKLNHIPVFVRAGTVLPLGPIIQHTNDLPGGPLELQVYPGKDATFTLVEDDGISTAYQQGQFRKTTFTWNESTRALSWKIEGPYAGKNIFTEMNIEVFDASGKHTSNAKLSANGEMKIAP